MIITTGYGTWNNHGDHYESTVEATVVSYLNLADADYFRRIEESGAFDQMVEDYRNAINDSLPDGVTLAGDQFYGPYYEADYTWDGGLDITSLIEDIDLGEIVERHDPDLERTTA